MLSPASSLRLPRSRCVYAFRDTLCGLQMPGAIVLNSKGSASATIIQAITPDFDVVLLNDPIEELKFNSYLLPVSRLL